MTTPREPISLVDIQTEFGGGDSISISEYYAGGAYTPNPQSGSFGSVPTGGTIDFNVFRLQTKIKPRPLPYPLIRFDIKVDRITVYRINMYTGVISVLSTSSSQTHSNNGILGVTNATELSKPTATATIVVEFQNRATYQYYVSHNPTAAEPYVDIVINDDPPSASWIATIRIDIQLGGGAVNPSVSTVPYYHHMDFSLTGGNNFSLYFVAYNLFPGRTYQFYVSGHGNMTVSGIADANTRVAFVNSGGVGYQMVDEYLTFDTVYNGGGVITYADGPFNGPDQAGSNR